MFCIGRWTENVCWDLCKLDIDSINISLYMQICMWTNLNAQEEMVQ